MAVCVALEGRCAGFTGPNMPSAIAALANLNVGTAYFDGELCGVDDAGLPSFAQTCGFRRSRPRIPIGSRPPIPI